MKSALVIGSAGFVGRHLCPRLEAEGYIVTKVDPKQPGVRMGMSFEEWLTQPPHKEFDCVFHLGAHIPDVSERMKGGLDKYQDIALDWAVMTYVLAHRPRQSFVWPSSCAVDTPEDPYAFGKIAGERFAMELHKSGIRTVILRPYSGYGEDQADTYPFPAILKRALARENPLTVWGDGLQMRDFIHIDDLVEAFIWAIDKAPAGIPIPIGTGLPTSMFHLALMIAKEVGYFPTIYCDQSKPSSSPYRIANEDMASSFGFETKIDIEEGIKRAVAARLSKVT